MLQDTLTAVDTLAKAVGGQVGAETTALVGLGLSAVTKFAVDGAKKVLGSLDTAPGIVKALVAVGFAQVATFISVKTGLLINPDVSALSTTVSGLVVALGSMGFHAVTKTLTKTTK